MNLWKFGAVAVVVFGGGLAACSSETSSGTGGSGGEGGEGTTGNTTTTGTQATTGTGTTGTGTSSVTSGSTGTTSNTTTTSSGGDCGGLPAEECGTCCQESLPDETDALVTYIVTACACGLEGGSATPPCETECADACAGGEIVADDPCDVCLNGVFETLDDPCVNDAAVGCTDDPGCSPILDCFGECQ
jgi:hypothetical protein